MKTFRNILLALVVTFISTSVSAQIAGNSKELVKQGVALHDEGKYAEAIQKYQEAIKIDAGNDLAYYKMAYTLFVSGKGKESLPF